MADKTQIDGKSPEGLTVDIGAKLARLRLSRNITQSELAENAGVSQRTLRRLESGAGTTLDSLVRVLLALKIQQNLDLLVPDPRIRPIERVRTGGSERQRSRPKTSANTARQWHWRTRE